MEWVEEGREEKEPGRGLHSCPALPPPHSSMGQEPSSSPALPGPPVSPRLRGAGRWWFPVWAEPQNPRFSGPTRSRRLRGWAWGLGIRFSGAPWVIRRRTCSAEVSGNQEPKAACLWASEGLLSTAWPSPPGRALFLLNVLAGWCLESTWASANKPAF